MRKYKISKQKLSIGAFYFFSYLATILVANLIATRLGVNKVISFCDEHSDICNLYGGSDLSEQLANDLIISIFVMLGPAVVLTSMISFVTSAPVFISKNQILRHVGATQPLLSAPYSSNQNSCLSLFKRFTENVFPSKASFYLLFMNCLSLFAGCTSLAYITASVAGEQICNPSFSVDMKCDIAEYPGASPSQLNQLYHLAEGTQTMIFHSGMILGAISSVLIILAVMSITACIKQRTLSQTEQRIESARPSYDLNSSLGL